MGKKQEYTCVSYVRMPDGNLCALSDMTPEDRAAWRERTIARVNAALGTYLTAHPEEIEPLSHCQGVTVTGEVRGDA